MTRTIAHCAVMSVCALTYATAQPSIDAGSAAHALAGAITARSGCGYGRWNASATNDTGSTATVHTRVVTGGLSGLIDGGVYGTRAFDSLVTVGVGIGALGYEAYNLIELMLSARRALSGALSGALAVRIETQSIQSYGTTAALLVDVGMHAALSDGIHVGAVARNVTRSHARGIARPQHIAIGLMAHLRDSTSLSFDFIHESGIGPTLSAGFETRIHSKLVLRGGIALESPTVTCGVGYGEGVLAVDVSLSWSAAVGVSYMAGAGWHW